MISAKDIPPLTLLKSIERRYPDFFSDADEAARYLRGKPGSGSGALPADAEEMAPVLEALAEWHSSKNVYDFDPTLTEELYMQAQKRLLVSPSFLRLPSRALYIRPNFGEGECGEDFYVYRSRVETRGLRFLTVRNGRPGRVLSLTVGEAEETLEDCLARFFAEQSGNPVSRDMAARWLTLVLYLSAVNADVERDEGHISRRLRVVPDIPRDVALWKVGQMMGARLRTMRRFLSISGENVFRENGGSLAAHIRHAHWRMYYTGSRQLPKAERRPILKWLAPIIVNGDIEVNVQEATLNRVTERRRRIE